VHRQREVPHDIQTEKGLHVIRPLFGSLEGLVPGQSGGGGRGEGGGGEGAGGGRGLGGGLFGGGGGGLLKP
jgi:hypothetical protein